MMQLKSKLKEETIVRLNELLGARKFADMTATQILNLLDADDDGNHKFEVKLLGQGATGAAILINDSVYKMWMVDSAYTEFVKYCLTHRGSPFLPKFQSKIKTMPAFFLRHHKAPDRVNFIKMEKLKPLESISAANSIKIKYGTEAHQSVALPFFLMGIEKAYRVKNDDGFEDNVIKGCNIANVDDNSEFRDILKIISDMQKFKYNLDLHTGNWMLRGDQVVLIDPISDSNDGELNELFYNFDMNLRLKKSDAINSAKQPSRSSK